MTFDKKLTNSVKGVAIMMMLVHHLFATEMLGKYSIDTLLISTDTLGWVCLQLKICVGIFVFLSAYGIAKQLKDTTLEKNTIFYGSVKRYIKLIMNFFVIYLMGMVGHFIFGKGIIEIYNTKNNSVLAGVYAIIDTLGLASLFKTPTINATWWYMTVAFMIIFLTPVLVMIYRKVGKLLPIICIFVSAPGTQLFNPYLLTVILAIWATEENILEKLYDKLWGKARWFIKILVFVILILIIPAMLWIRNYTGFTYWLDAFVSMIICLICMVLKKLLPFIPRALEFLGKYSMNIFLSHTFIYYYFFSDIIYKFSDAIVIFVVLLILSLILSIVIEFIKRKLGFYNLVNYITKKIGTEGKAENKGK